ncbi:FadR/GntR family transcriptional regulator [Xylophilus sp. GOD-11R]|uniref:FadR/GntR family transcriptional regulator n=1 Tax=Xylophilus sp. GOD-11R TaxID=3089814 RepID=UPI00298C90C6|nr:FadR/GntR family transcriptional regulator [Xylophilus sp. GOD-11R]WPB58295.1 FadR/GntR family transcriptional regulator [Xylophilus sp. GOD-11R]
MQTDNPVEGTLTDRMAGVLASQIRSGAWQPQTRLPTESTLMLQYGVSRTVVREALSRLRSEGLVETRQGSGTVVQELSASDSFRLGAAVNPAEGVLRILELRRGIEAEMAALAAERRTAADMRDIEKALKAIATATDHGGDGVAQDLAFHMAISNAAHNPHFPELLGMLGRALHDAIALGRRNEAMRPELAAQVLLEHAALIEGIRARDPAAAREAAHAHMRESAERLRRVGADFWKDDAVARARRVARTRINAT